MFSFRNPNYEMSYEDELLQAQINNPTLNDIYAGRNPSVPPAVSANPEVPPAYSVIPPEAVSPNPSVPEAIEAEQVQATDLDGNPVVQEDVEQYAQSAQPAPSEDQGFLSGLFKGLQNVGGALVEMSGGDKTASPLENIARGLEMYAANQYGNDQEYATAVNKYDQRIQGRRAEAAKEKERAAAEKRYQDELSWNRAQAEKEYQTKMMQWASPESYMKYKETGNLADLVKADEKMTEYQRLSLEQQRRNHNDSMAMQRARLAQSQAQNGSLSSSDIQEARKGEDGNWYIPKYSKQGVRWEPAGAQLQKILSEREQAGRPDTNATQLNQDLNDLEKLSKDGKTGTITGKVAQLDRGTDNTPGIATLLRNTFGSEEENQAAQLAARVDGRMRSAGVADAKAMGASGINTAAEAELYFQGMPRLNYSSNEALQRSIGEVRDYTRAWNAQRGVTSNSTLRPEVINPNPQAPAAVSPNPAAPQVVSPSPKKPDFGTKYNY